MHFHWPRTNSCSATRAGRRNGPQPNKPVGSIHGDSIGVHACDTIHAWRNLSRAGDRRTQVTSLILAGYNVARDRGNRSEFLKWDPYPAPIIRRR